LWLLSEKGFFLNVDSFDPHEPWDPPRELVDPFDPGAYDVEGWTAASPYTRWREVLTEEQFTSFRASTWLSDKRSDPNELQNLADERPGKLLEMQQALRRKLEELDAPPEQIQRLGL
jgi:hypothetical protein